MGELQLDELVGAVARARRELEEARAVLRAKEEFLEPFREAVREASMRVEEAEERLREAARVVYEATGNKSPHPAIGIRIMTRLEYDVGPALDYCRQHLPTALKLDKAAFEKAARAIPLDFVTKREEPQVTIAQKLEV